MDIYKLKSFYTVAKLKSFSRAAEVLYLSQPAVSAQIKDLESDYETRLFDRIGRNIELTRSGQELLLYVEKILNLHEESHHALDLLKNVKDGNIKIAVCELPGISLLPAIMASFKEDYPGVTFSLSTGRSSEIIDSIKKNQFDLGFIVYSHEELSKSDLNSTLLYRDRIVLGVSKNNPLARQDRINVKDLSNLPLIVSSRDTVSRQALDEMFREHSIPFNIAYEIENKSMTKSMVERNLGSALFSYLEIQNKARSGSISILEIEETPIYRYVHMILNKNRSLSPTVQAFFDYISQLENRGIHDILSSSPSDPVRTGKDGCSD